MKILHLDTNHPILWNLLESAGFENILDTQSTAEEIVAKIKIFEGIVIRSRIPMDKAFLEKASHLKFIARVGAGVENIDIETADRLGIKLISAPEGNRTAVGEHALGMLLSLMNKLALADLSVRRGEWLREEHRGYELEGKTVGIIGYGNMGKSFAKRLQGFDVQVVCYDIAPNVGDQNAEQVDWLTFRNKVDVISLHTPWTPLTHHMINDDFINQIRKPFWLVNTARGKNIVTSALLKGIENGKINGAALDVLEFEKSSFEKLEAHEMPEELRALFSNSKVLLSPHVAGWTFESHEKLGKVIAQKVIDSFVTK